MQDPRQAAEKRVGETLNGKWHLDRLLDIGGMAGVYEATHRNGKRVAVKMLHPMLSAEPQIRERFLREGYVANKVDHPGAVQILDDDTTPDGGVFLVMELLEGESLDTYIKRMGGTLRVVEVLAIADQVLGVLAAAHAKQIVHRDIKPANLFISGDGHIKVLDFGLARVRDGKMSGAPTAMGTILGTYQYMPPEQARGKTNVMDGRTDVFAVGAVMFRALTGRYVHAGDTAHEILLNAMKDRAPSLATVAPNIPAAVVQVVDKSLVYEMDGRYATAEAMQHAVREAFGAIRDAPERQTLPSAVGAESAPASVVVDVSFGDHRLEEVSAILDEGPDDAPARSTQVSPIAPPKTGK